MADGIYAALSGALAQAQALDTVANNLANGSTEGFKAQRLSFEETLLAQPGAAPQSQTAVRTASTDFSQGGIQDTGNPLDVALLGEGFLTVETNAGVRYTRAGSLTLSPEGTLVTSAGHPVLGTNGTIEIGQARRVTIDEHGQVLRDGVVLGQLARVRFAEPQRLVREGERLWSAPAGVEPEPIDVRVQSGALERSNVNALTEMSELIWISRAYEIFHRSIETFDSADQKAASELGR